MKTIKFFSIVVALAALALVGCGGGNNGGGGCTSNCTPPPGKVTVTCISQIQIGVTSNNYACTASEAVTWSVDNASLATITGAGILTPNTTSTGTVTVTGTATSGNDTPGTATVKVVDWILYNDVSGVVTVVNSDGNNQTALLSKTTGCDYLARSYDRLKFVCENILSTDPEIMIYSTDGSAAGTKELNVLDMSTIGGINMAQFPSFSPDGTKIVFIGLKVNSALGPQNEAATWVMNVDGTGLTKLAAEPYGDGIFPSAPFFSPDGKEILYQKSGYVWLMNADGTNQHQLVNVPSSLAMFSPDGSKLYYTGSSGIFMAAAGGTGAVQIVAGYALGGISPNGESITFYENAGNGGIFVAAADGTNQKQIAATGALSVW